jgi:hypothetical protein
LVSLNSSLNNKEALSVDSEGNLHLDPLDRWDKARECSQVKWADRWAAKWDNKVKWDRPQVFLALKWAASLDKVRVCSEVKWEAKWVRWGDLDNNNLSKVLYLAALLQLLVINLSSNNSRSLDYLEQWVVALQV